MNTMTKFFAYFLILFVFFTTACTDNTPDPFPADQVNGFYCFNYGAYGQGGASITKYNFEKNELTNKYYELQNGGMELLSNIQYAGIHNDSIYIIGNSPDEIITLNKLFVQSQNGVNTDIANPRYFIGHGDYLYISCLGSSPDWSEMPDTYIAKFNTKTNSVEKIIDLPGGPEGLAIANGKLYAALNYKESIAVIDLNNYSISHIETPAVSSYFLKDKNNNLYVSLISTWNNSSIEDGIGYINTSTNTLEEVFVLNGISSGYSSIMAATPDFTSIYVIASAWVEEADGTWVQKGAAYTLNTASGTYEIFAENITGANGVVYNHTSNEVYIFTSSSTSEAGVIRVYSEAGTFIKDIVAGASPYWGLFIE